MKSKKELQIEAVKAIINGDLLFEEAMVKYHVKDKRTMSAWINKTIPLLKTPKPESKISAGSSFNTIAASSEHMMTDILREENSLLKKVIDLLDKVRELEDKNTLLTRHRDLLMEKVSSLELRVQIQQKEMK
ncbi:hypothetical protein FXV77_01075 [Sphingobacterium phlebotomi]|uniref:Uncharacterized protein n=1 Tax=Sphingobacterium phlebotomi TaxID=2605433 RepID=A0A5D4HDL6_9SPHI|nr:hypothetical protein [Sphingobacterium phlebotomi]TYR37909.1 hypothetical protein FXV77_01075 [Sphingobacterium phlebotomi]